MVDIYGNRFPNRLYGTRQGERIIGRGGDDIIYGNGGNDVLSGQDGDDTFHIELLPSPSGNSWDSESFVRGGSGHDKAVLHFEVVTTDITFNAQFDLVSAKSPSGSIHDKRLVFMDSVEEIEAYFGSGKDYYHSNGADNRVSAGAGTDRLVGAGGKDYLNGEDGDDVLFGYANNDYLIGGNGDDLIYGGVGRDFLYGATGADQLHGQKDDDHIDGYSGDDRITGGAGNDRLYGSDGDDIVYGGDDGDSLNGGIGADMLSGDDGLDKLLGGEGADLLKGGAGNDVIDGGSGWDRIHGGAGIDRLSGGGGHDRFIWADASEGGDRILDFTSGQDMLLFDSAGFSGVTNVDTGNFASNAFGVATTADQRFLFSEQMRALFFDPDGSGASAKILIAHIDFAVGTHIQASDIVIV